MEEKNYSYDLSIIIPVYNEVNSIGKVIEDIYDKIIKEFPKKAEVVIAEDGSIDGTKEFLAKLQVEKKFRLISGKERKGYNLALKDALALTQGKYVFMCDSGGAHEIGDFMKMYQYVNDYSIVSGFKKKRGDPLYRIILSKIYNAYVSILFVHKFYDIDSGFKIYRKEALDQVLPGVKVLKECISTEIVLRIFQNGGKIKEVPVIHYKRNFGGPAKTFSYKKLPKIVIRLFIDLLKLRSKI